MQIMQAEPVRLAAAQDASGRGRPAAARWAGQDAQDLQHGPWGTRNGTLSFQSSSLFHIRLHEVIVECLARTRLKNPNAECVQPGSGNAIVVTEGIGRHRPHGPLPFKICLSCHSQLPNAPKEKIISGAAYGGGFQLFLPGTPPQAGYRFCQPRSHRREAGVLES